VYKEAGDALTSRKIDKRNEVAQVAMDATIRDETNQVESVPTVCTLRSGSEQRVIREKVSVSDAVVDP
jgi:hypothetical protein